MVMRLELNERIGLFAGATAHIYICCTQILNYLFVYVVQTYLYFCSPGVKWGIA